MLNLGIWMPLQSMVEKNDCKKVMQHDEWSKTVMDCFEEILKQMLEKVAERWKQVLYLIQAGKGRNELTKQHCDNDMRKFVELTEVDLYEEDDKNDMVLDEELLSNNEDEDEDE